MDEIQFRVLLHPGAVVVRQDQRVVALLGAVLQPNRMLLHNAMEEQKRQEALDMDDEDDDE